jgi:hypothetical protein
MRPTWLASRFPTFSSYCADRSKLSQALPLSKVDRFRALWHETVLRSFDIFYVSCKCCYFIINKLYCFLCFWVFFIFLLLLLHKQLESNWCLQ